MTGIIKKKSLTSIIPAFPFKYILGNANEKQCVGRDRTTIKGFSDSVLPVYLKNLKFLAT